MKITAKKSALVTAVSFLFLLVCSLVAYFLRFVKFSGAVTPLVIGLGLILVGGVLVIFAKERLALNIPVFFISAVAFGFCLKSWYIFRGFDNSIFVMLLTAVCAAAYLWIFFLFSKIPIFERHPLIFTVVYSALSLAVYLCVMLNTETTYVSTFGYYLIIQLAFVYAMYTDSDTPRGVVHSFALSTFSVFGAVVLAATLIAVCILGDGDCDADCFECAECFDCVGDIKTKKKR